MQKGWKIVGLIVGTLLPALVTSYFSYKQAQVEANAGYVELVKEVQELHDRVIVLETTCLQFQHSEHHRLPSTLNEAYQMEKK